MTLPKILLFVITLSVSLDAVSQIYKSNFLEFNDSRINQDSSKEVNLIIDLRKVKLKKGFFVLNAKMNNLNDYDYRKIHSFCGGIFLTGSFISIYDCDTNYLTGVSIIPKLSPCFDDTTKHYVIPAKSSIKGTTFYHSNLNGYKLNKGNYLFRLSFTHDTTKTIYSNYYEYKLSKGIEP